MRIALEVLSDDEIRLRSYGRVEVPFAECLTHWRQRSKTVLDPSIFGFELDWSCACRKYCGQQYVDHICDVCGVIVGIAGNLRRSRFGHIDLSRKVPHPLCSDKQIGAIAVLPIGYRCDVHEEDLNLLYGRVVAANGRAAQQEAIQKGTDMKLSQRVRQLFCNELLTEPYTHEGRIVRALSYFGFTSPGASLGDIGHYLWALGLRVSVQALQDSGE